MLFITFNPKEGMIFNIDAWFNNNYEDEWFEDPR